MDQSLSSKARLLVSQASVLQSANSLEKMQKAPALIAEVLSLLLVMSERIETLEDSHQ